MRLYKAGNGEFAAVREIHLLNVYVDTGGMHPSVTELEVAGLLQTHYFPFEQRNRRVRIIVPGSGATYEQGNLSWKEVVGTWDDLEPSPAFSNILKIVRGHKVDAQHLDSAYKSGCTVFLTSDKTDIWSNRSELLEQIGLHILHVPSEIDRLADLARLIESPFKT